MPSRYAQWMYDWEHRLTRWTTTAWYALWSGVWNTLRTGLARMVARRSGRRQSREVPHDFNRRIVASSDEFYSYKTPTDFRLEKREVKVFSTREVPDPKLEAKVNGTFAEFLRVHRAGENALSRKQSGECALVPLARAPCHRSSAALERRRHRLRQPLPRAEPDGDLRTAS